MNPDGFTTLGISESESELPSPLTSPPEMQSSIQLEGRITHLTNQLSVDAK